MARRSPVLPALGLASLAALGLLWWQRRKVAGAAGSALATATGEDVSTIVRDLERLQPEMRARLERALATMRARGYSPYVAETWRSAARQAYLYSQGYSRVQSGGYHGQGLAADVVDGSTDAATGKMRAWNTSPEWWAAWGAAAEAEGLTWGGRWTTIYDPAHVQLGA